MTDKRVFLIILLAGMIWASVAAMTGDDSTGSPATFAELTPVKDGARPPGSSMSRDFPTLAGATAWLNSPPLTPQGLRGKVVLVEFWTYTCINWRREFPYVRAWAAKYRESGLVVIGVHSPEFTFEQNRDNIARAAKEIGVDHAIAVDSNQAIWRAFNNSYWPALYFIDAKGRVRHDHFGEGDYEESERFIQQLLLEAGAAGVPSDLVGNIGKGAEAAPDWSSLRSPENYVGLARTSGLRSAGAAPDRQRSYEMPPRLAVNEWGLAGDWILRDEAAVLQKVNGRIAYAFHARDLHLVMGPSTPGTPLRFRIALDGKPPGQARGLDVDEQGLGTISEPRMYQLIRQLGPIRDRRFEIEFLDPGVQVFSFTFG